MDHRHTITLTPQRTCPLMIGPGSGSYVIVLLITCDICFYSSLPELFEG